MRRLATPPHTRLAALALALAAAACGGGDGGDDGAPPAEARWVASAIRVPATGAEASAWAFDLTGDGAPDNKLGALLANLAANGASPATGVAEAVARGELIYLVRVLPGADGVVDAWLSEGSDPSPAPCLDPAVLATCGQHLAGTGSFTPSLISTLAGREAGGVLTVGPGTAALPLVLGGTTLLVPLSAARLRVDRRGVPVTGVLGGAIRQADLDAVVLPAVAAAMTAAIADFGFFDTDGDGTVTAEELRANALVAAALAPDVDLDGTGGPDALSVGVGLQLVTATF